MMQANGSTNGQHTAAIVPVAHGNIEPQSLSELRSLAKDAATTRFFGATTPEQALLVMMSGRDLGLSYTQSLRAFFVVEGRPTLSADGMVAVCLQHRDVCESFRLVSADDKSATWETKRRGQEPVRYTYTLAEAQIAGLVKPSSGWAKHPRRMCSARAKSFLARDVYPELLMGLYDPDELRESAAPERHEAPRQVVEMTIVRDDPAEGMATRLRQCATKQDWDAIVAAMKVAKDQGEISADDFANLKTLAKARAADIKAASAAPVVVEATATHDADGVVVEPHERQPGED